MKKRICFLIYIVLAIQCLFCSNISAQETDTNNKERYILDYFGIIASEQGENSKTFVNRAEFAGYIATMLGIEPVADKKYFYDVTQNEAAGKINALYELKIVSGVGENNFEPDSPITYEHARKMIIRALGYAQYADAVNATYSAMADKLGIYTYPENRLALNKEDAVLLIYRAMEAPLLSDNFDGLNIALTIDEDENLFSKRYNVYRYEGQVLAEYNARISDSVYIEDNEVMIGNTVYEIDSALDYKSLLGYNVEYLYKDNGDDTYTLIYAEPDSKTRITEILSQYVEAFDLDTYKLSYYKDNYAQRLSDVKIQRGAKIIFNGMPISRNLTDIFDDFINENKKGYVCLIDNGSGVELVIIKSYETFVAGGYDETKNIIYNYYDNTDKIELSEYNIVTMKDSDEVEASIPFSMPVVLNVAFSDDGQIAEIIINNTKKTIKVTGCDSEERVLKTSDGNSKMDKYLYQQVKDVLKIGMHYVVMYDAFEEIAHMEKNADGMQIGYLRKVYYDIENECLLMKIYTREDVFKTIPVAERVKIDAKLFKRLTPKELVEVFPGENYFESDGTGSVIKIERQVIRYKLNDEDAITEIDTRNVGSNEDSKNTLTRKHDGTMKLYFTYSTYNSRFGLDSLIDSNKTAIFAVPTFDADGNVLLNGNIYDEDESLYHTDYMFIGDRSYLVETYNYDEDNFYEDIVVAHIDNVVENEYYFMFDKLETIYDETEDTVYDVIEGKCYSGTVSFSVEESCMAQAETLKQGDIIRVDTDSSGKKAVAINKMFDFETRTFNNNGLNEHWYGGTFNVNGGSAYKNVKYQLSKGIVYDKNGQIIRVTYDSEDARDGVINETINTMDFGIIVYDSSLRKNNIYEGTVDDILTYRLAGNDASYAIIGVMNYRPRTLFIYK